MSARSRAARRATTRSLPVRVADAMREKPRAVRWLVAELIPLGCVFVGLFLDWLGTPAGLIPAFIGGIILTTWYLSWVQSANPVWVLPLIGLMLPAMYVGGFIFGHPLGTPIVVTPAYWQALAGLLAAVAVTVALAIMNGERHHTRRYY
jgi:hypothetical protein